MNPETPTLCVIYAAKSTADRNASIPMAMNTLVSSPSDTRRN